MMSRNSWKIVVLGVFIAAIALGASACSGSKAQPARANSSPDADNAPQPIEATTAQAIARQLPRFYEATGTLAADEQTDVAPAIAGKVTAVYGDLGTFVQKGTVLVRLDDRDAKIRLDQSQAQLEQAKAAVAQSEARIGLKPGQQFDPERVPEVGAARATLQLADIQLRRFERLADSGDVSKSGYDQQRAQRDQLKEQYEAQLQAARQNYAGVLAARAAVTTAQTQVEQAKKSLTDTIINAPISGYIADRPADVGEYVSTSTKVVTLVRTNVLRVRIDIPEQAVSDVKVGQSVSVAVSAYPDRNFSGRIARIAPSFSANSRTMTVEAEIVNSDGQLKPGQFATVRIQQPQGAPSVLVPQRAVRTEAGTSRVFVVKDGKVEQRLVQLGQTDGDLIEIRGGVAANETVATSNLDRLSDGIVVKQ